VDLLNRASYHYHLPPELIAQHPLPQRDAARLMVVDRQKQTIEHHHFYDIINYLEKDDVLVINTSKVFPARLYGHKHTGAKIEVLLLHPIKDNFWCVLIKPVARLKVGDEIIFSENLSAIYFGQIENDRVIGLIAKKGLYETLLEIGEIPLPHYIKRKPDESDNETYQTVYAKESGSVAAPTAGLHFTQDLLKKIKNKGVKIAKVVLSVGAGTFQPVKVDNITEHPMHIEYCGITKSNAKIINTAKENGKRVIAVGTTSTRTLETFADGSQIKTGGTWTRIFIYPGKEIKIADCLVTNFHLPESTLLMLVCAFAGYDLTMQAYQTAIDQKYRFFSYGDAMLVV